MDFKILDSGDSGQSVLLCDFLPVDLDFSILRSRLYLNGKFLLKNDFISLLRALGRFYCAAEIKRRRFPMRYSYTMLLNELSKRNFLNVTISC